MKKRLLNFVSLAELLMFWVWCKMKGKRFFLDQTATKPGKCYLVLRELPDSFLVIFGINIQFWVPIVFEQMELDCPGPEPDVVCRVFHQLDQCEKCGLNLKEIKRKARR